MIVPLFHLVIDRAFTDDTPAAAPSLDRGFACDEVAKIMGGNMRRLLKATLG